MPKTSFMSVFLVCWSLKSGVVYGWGDGTNEKLGEVRKPNENIQITPKIIVQLDVPITKICSGAGFCAGLTTEGKIMTWARVKIWRI